MSKNQLSLGVPGAAAFLNLSIPRIKKLSQEGRIGQKIAGRYLFSQAELQRFSRQKRTAGRKPGVPQPRPKKTLE